MIWYVLECGHYVNFFKQEAGELEKHEVGESIYCRKCVMKRKIVKVEPE